MIVRVVLVGWLILTGWATLIHLQETWRMQQWRENVQERCLAPQLKKGR